MSIGIFSIEYWVLRFVVLSIETFGIEILVLRLFVLSIGSGNSCHWSVVIGILVTCYWVIYY